MTPLLTHQSNCRLALSHRQDVFHQWLRPCSAIYSKCTQFALNTLRPRQNGRHFADDIFKCIFVNENVWIPIKISLKFVPKGPINNIPALVQIMAWRRAGDKPLSEPMLVSLPTLICVTRPQWVKWTSTDQFHSHFLRLLYWNQDNDTLVSLPAKQLQWLWVNE